MKYRFSSFLQNYKIWHMYLNLVNTEAPTKFQYLKSKCFFYYANFMLIICMFYFQF